MSILIGLLTCHAHRERDAICLNTWIPVARQLGMRVVFLIGEGRDAPPTWLDGDYLRIPCLDDYISLPCKTRALAQWALTQPGWDRILKADNDSLVIPERLAAVSMDGIDYRGSEPGIKWFGYASGAGYLLSRRAAQVVADTLVNRKGAEDQLVGRALKRAGIELTKDPRFDPWGRDPPTPQNDKVTTHKLDRERWLACWGQFHP
jgi:hypothetical protein